MRQAHLFPLCFFLSTCLSISFPPQIRSMLRNLIIIGHLKVHFIHTLLAFHRMSQMPTEKLTCLTRLNVVRAPSVGW